MRARGGVVTIVGRRASAAAPDMGASTHPSTTVRHPTRVSHNPGWMPGAA